MAIDETLLLEREEDGAGRRSGPDDVDGGDSGDNGLHDFFKNRSSVSQCEAGHFVPGETKKKRETVYIYSKIEDMRRKDISRDLCTVASLGDSARQLPE